MCSSADTLPLQLCPEPALSYHLVQQVLPTLCSHYLPALNYLKIELKQPFKNQMGHEKKKQEWVWDGILTSTGQVQNHWVLG